MSEIMSAVAVLTTSFLSMVDFLYRVYNSEERRQNRKETEKNKPYIRTLFGAALYPSQVIMPQKDFYLMENPTGVITLKSAKIAYETILEQIHASFSEKVRHIMHERKIDYGKNLFTVGSRTANKFVNDEFEEWHKHLNLRWTVGNPEKQDARLCRYSGGELYSRPNFRIHDSEKGKYLEVRTEERWDEGRKGRGLGPGNYTFMANDYLLITKGPSHEAGEKLFHVNFGGLHGVGTRATANFLKKTEWLEESSKKIREHEYYQILLPVNKIHHDSRIRESIPVDFGRPMIHPLSEKKSRSA